MGKNICVDNYWENIKVITQLNEIDKRSHLTVNLLFMKGLQVPRSCILEHLISVSLCSFDPGDCLCPACCSHHPGGVEASQTTALHGQ